MWSPNTLTTTKANDNKIREEVDDCRCGDAGAGSSGGGAGASGSTVQQQQQQQQLNVFDNNSKKSASTFGGNLPTHEDDELKGKELIHAAETGDSGFISGPQSSNIFHEEAQDEPKGNVPQQKYNIAPGPFVGKEADAAEEEKTVLDSGCIDEDESFADEDDNDDGSHEAVASAAQKRIGAATATAEQLQQQHVGVRNELSAAKSKIGTSASNSNSTSSSISSSNTEQMILKQNVDAGMSEWFCNLRLQTEAAPRPQTQPQQQQQQQQQQQIAGTSLNNLDAAARKSANTSSRQQQTQLQQQQQSAGNSATHTTNTNATTTTSNTTSNLTPSNAWEQFYQQNDDGDTPLHLACISGYVDVVAALIRMAPHPCLFNIQNDEAQTPLHLAALTAQPKILRMLLIAGAEPTIRDRHGNTALHLACMPGEEQCVRALTIPISASEINEAHRQYGHRSNDKTVSYLSYARLPSDLEIRNYDGERCVHLAAQGGHIDILRILVLYGADINAREGKSGRTPLHIAIECCNEDLANFLLDECQKLNLETATYAGLTAYQVACILNKSQMQNILEKRGAEPLTPPDSDYDSSDIETDLDETKSYDRFGDPGYFANYKGGNAMTVA